MEEVSNQEVIEQALRLAIPVLQVLEKLYGPMQHTQPDGTQMYYCNRNYLRVGDVKQAEAILKLLIDNGIIEAPVEVVVVPKKVDGRRRKPMHDFD